VIWGELLMIFKTRKWISSFMALVQEGCVGTLPPYRFFPQQGREAT